jgi:hypothetical protein
MDLVMFFSPLASLPTSAGVPTLYFLFLSVTIGALVGTGMRSPMRFVLGYGRDEAAKVADKSWALFRTPS